MKAAQFDELVGTEVGVTEWMEVTQARVDAFADATDDHQWIHVDQEKAAAGPFGGTIAHGFLTLSLTVRFALEVELDVGEPKMAINYGLEKVRFPAPVPVGSWIRGRIGLVSVSDVPGGIQVVYRKPVPIHETVILRARVVQSDDKKAIVACSLYVGDEEYVVGEVVAVRMPPDWMPER